MSQYLKKYIITGAPGTGKTTLINYLSKEYACMNEVSRKVISGEQEKGGDGTPWQNLPKFARLLYQAFILELDSNPQAQFTDRSLLDLIAYLQLEGHPIPTELKHFPYHDQFMNQVFFAPAWETIYHQDAQRQQSFAYCEKLEKSLRQSYQQLGFEVIILPRVSVSERVVFVKAHVGANM